MKENWTSGRFYQFCNVIMRIAYVNILWIGFTLLGLGILGFFPATIALFSVVRKWLMNETDIPVFKSFFKTYKTEFLKGNVVGLIMAISGYIIYFNYLYLANIQGNLYLIFLAALFIITVFYLITLFYLLPVYAHYELTVFQSIKHAFYIGIANPLLTIIMFMGNILCVLFLYYVPGFIPFFFPAIFAIVMMFTGLRGFKKIEFKKQTYAAI